MRRIFIRFALFCCSLSYIAYVSLPSAARSSWSLKQITVEHGWAQLDGDGPGTSNVYLTIRNGSDIDDYLLAVDSSLAASTMIHDEKKQPIPGGLIIPSYDQITMKPKSIHVMLSGISKSVSGGGFLPLRVVFRDAGTLDISVPFTSQ